MRRIIFASLMVLFALLPGIRDVKAQGAGSDMVIVLDDSASMTEYWPEGGKMMPPNDPENLRYSAARLFIDLAQPGDRIAVLSFGSQATGLGKTSGCAISDPGDRLPPGCRLVEITERDRGALKAAINPPARGAPQTRMDLGLALAGGILKADNAGRPQHILFLTDGLPYPEDQRPALYKVIADLRQTGVQVSPVLLGGYTDNEVARRLSEREPYRAASAGDLLGIFAAIYADIHPGRFIEEIRPSRGDLEFRTSPSQGITRLAVVFPRADGRDLLEEFSLNDEKIRGRSTLSNGATVTASTDRHYGVLIIKHNRPLAGLWEGRLRAGRVLVIAEAQVEISLISPPPAREGLFPEVHYYPRGKQVLLAATVRRNGQEWSGETLQVEGKRLGSRGLSPNETVYWSLFTPPADGGKVTIQLGEEVAPLRLRKAFSLLPGDFPRLIADSPSPASPGLTSGGRLLLKAHLEPGGDLREISVQAIVQDESLGGTMAYRAQLKCEGRVCSDDGFRPEPGHNYKVWFLAKARSGGVKYGDFAQGALSAEPLIIIGNLPDLLDPQGEDSLTLEIVAHTEVDPGPLTATLDLQSGGKKVEGVTAMVSSPSILKAGNYRGKLIFRGLKELPPGDYWGILRFSSGVRVVPGEVPVRFSILTPWQQAWARIGSFLWEWFWPRLHWKPFAVTLAFFLFFVIYRIRQHRAYRPPHNNPETPEDVNPLPGGWDPLRELTGGGYGEDNLPALNSWPFEGEDLLTGLVGGGDGQDLLALNDRSSNPPGESDLEDLFT